MNLDLDRYHELIHAIDIKAINLKDLVVKSLSDTHQENIEISLEQEISSYLRKNELLNVLVKYEVKGFTKSENKFSIEFSLEVNYILDSQLKFENEYLEMFTQNNVPLNVWPFARELVHNLTTKMGLPPLILPLLRINTIDVNNRG